MPRALTEAVKKRIEELKHLIYKHGAMKLADIKKLTGYTSLQILYTLRMLEKEGSIVCRTMGLKVCAKDSESLHNYIIAECRRIIDTAKKGVLPLNKITKNAREINYYASILMYCKDYIDGIDVVLLRNKGANKWAVVVKKHG